MADQDLDQRIRRRAYELWEQEGRPEGRELDHWQQAEAEVAGIDAGAADRQEAAGVDAGASGTQGTAGVGAGASDTQEAAGADAGAADKQRARRPRRASGTKTKGGARGADKEEGPSDLAADEGAKGGGGVGP